MLRTERVYGIETEYQLNTKTGFFNTRLASLSDLDNVGHKLGNGGGTYVDIGMHPEYNTPECSTIEEVVAHDIAGEDTMLQAVTAAAAWKEDDEPEDAPPNGIIHFNKRVDDIHEDPHNACGVHDNYLTPRGLYPGRSEVYGPLALFNTTINIFVGGGRYDSTTHTWVPSQKAPSINTLVSMDTTSEKPLVNLRDEPHADPRKYRRLHNTCSDATISPWATRLRIGATSALLYMLEGGEDLSDLQLDWFTWAEAVEIAGNDPTLQRPIRLASGKTIRPLDVQMEFAQRAKAFAEEHPLPVDIQNIIDIWLTAGADAERDVMSLARRADWVARMLVADRKRAKDPWTDEVRQMKTIDIQYSHIGPVPDTTMTTGIGPHLRDQGYFEWSPSQETIDQARRLPPTTTRAVVRGRFVRGICDEDRRGKDRRHATADWQDIGVGTEGGLVRFLMPEPRRTSYPIIEEVIAKLEDGTLPLDQNTTA